MNSWFECKIKYEKLDENGTNKSVTEAFIIDALSHAEAETRICEEMKPYISGEFSVASVRRQKIAEIYSDETAAYWFKVKVMFIYLDEEKRVEKRTPVTIYAQADDIEKALKSVHTGLKGTISDYEIASISATSIMDVFPYSETKK